MGDKYVYPGTKILVNKLGIRDKKLLEKKEKIYLEPDFLS